MPVRRRSGWLGLWAALICVIGVLFWIGHEHYYEIRLRVAHVAIDLDVCERWAFGVVAEEMLKHVIEATAGSGFQSDVIIKLSAEDMQNLPAAIKTAIVKSEDID